MTGLNTDYMNRHMQARLPRPATTPSWPSSLSQSRTPTQATYLSRAVTEVNMVWIVGFIIISSSGEGAECQT